MTLYQFGILCITTFFSCIIKTGAGIGSGLFVVPVLSLAFPTKVALGISAPMMFFSDFVSLRLYWKEWTEWRVARDLFIGAVAGLTLGAFLITLIPPPAFRLGLGVFALCFSTWQLGRMFVFPPKGGGGKTLGERHPYLDKALMFTVGVFGGIASALAHSGGLVWSTYMVTKARKRSFVASLMLMFAASNTYKIITFLGIDILQWKDILWVMGTFPVILLGSWIGNTLNRKISVRHFRMVVFVIIFILGVSLLV